MTILSLEPSNRFHQIPSKTDFQELTWTLQKKFLCEGRRDHVHKSYSIQRRSHEISVTKIFSSLKTLQIYSQKVLTDLVNLQKIW